MKLDSPWCVYFGRIQLLIGQRSDDTSNDTREFVYNVCRKLRGTTHRPPVLYNYIKFSRLRDILVICTLMNFARNKYRELRFSMMKHSVERRIWKLATLQTLIFRIWGHPIRNFPCSVRTIEQTNFNSNFVIYFVFAPESLSAKFSKSLRSMYCVEFLYFRSYSIHCEIYVLRTSIMNICNNLCYVTFTMCALCV